MIRDRLYLTADFLCSALKAICPYDTGNLCNSIRVYETEQGVFVGIGDETTPYKSKDTTVNNVAIITNEPWKRGNNPNEGWIERGINSAMETMRQILGGELTDEEVRELVTENEQRLFERQQDKAAEL